jgi:hypothetical protein
MERLIYAIITGYIAVLMSYVSTLRHEPLCAAWSAVIAVIIFVLTIICLWDERNYYKRFVSHSITIWGKDFN